ncbi:MAG: hypothetical protein PHP79_02535 [Clostridia bacterium]|nr:hypothetical protein [Clostridia bacterium]
MYTAHTRKIDTLNQSLVAHVIGTANKVKPLNKGGFPISFFERMIYLFLIDADFLDTESFVNDNTVDRKVKNDFKFFYKY